MSSPKEVIWHVDAPRPVADAVRVLAAALLASAGAVLGRLSARLVARPKVVVADPLLEFHAEAGAPEGALYVDGQLVGWIAGVTRL
jgi:hypothetical protein